MNSKYLRSLQDYFSDKNVVRYVLPTLGLGAVGLALFSSTRKNAERAERKEFEEALSHVCSDPVLKKDIEHLSIAEVRRLHGILKPRREV